MVHKLSRKLTFYQGITPLKTYPIVLGNDPYNDKLCQGDTCTPEGVYRVRAKYPHSKWDAFIWLDYPNTQNWLKFAQAKKAGRLPPDADIGGQVGIHGTEDPTRNQSGEQLDQGLRLLAEPRPGRDLPAGGRQDPGGHLQAISALKCDLTKGRRLNATGLFLFEPKWRAGAGAGSGTAEGGGSKFGESRGWRPSGPPLEVMGII